MRVPFLAAVLATSTLLAAQPGLAKTKVREVDVTADIAAIQNPKAAAFWANAADDLENAIVARLTDRLSQDEGVKVAVDLDEISLANSYESAAGIAESSLSGSVKVLADNGSDDTRVYDLTVRFDRAYLPAGVDLAAVTTDSPDHYRALIDGFADQVVQSVK